jgi:hypothetical protein
VRVGEVALEVGVRRVELAGAVVDEVSTLGDGEGGDAAGGVGQLLDPACTSSGAKR